MYGIGSCSTNQFCGCNKITQINPELGEGLPIKIFIFIAFIFIYTSLSITLGTGWFVFKDYYPLKQRSPILCLMMLLLISVQILLYPVLYLYQFFGSGFEQIIQVYRVVWFSLKGSAQFIYFLRSMRIIYAHETHPSRSKTPIFKIFKSQFILAAITILMLILRAIPIIIAQQINPLYIPIQFISPFRDQIDSESDYLIKMMVSEFLWSLLLVYCFWLQYYVNHKYTIAKEILIVVIFKIVISFVGLIYLIISTTQQEDEQLSLDIFRNLCIEFQFYPIVQLYSIAVIIVILIVSILLPLHGRKIYHMLLPTGRQYGLVKTMRDFLLQKQFLEVFEQFLKHRDLQNQNHQYESVLGFWKKLIVLKYNFHEEQITKVREVRRIIEDLQTILLKKHPQLVINLKTSIAGMEQSLYSSDHEKLKHRDSINDKVDELQIIAIDKLDKIYKQEFSKTQSYHYLKEKVKTYKRININMILLNLALMTDSVEDENI